MIIIVFPLFAALIIFMQKNKPIRMSTSLNTVTKDDLLLLKIPDTIDEVIFQLEQIIAYCEINNSPADTHHTVFASSAKSAGNITPHLLLN